MQIDYGYCDPGENSVKARCRSAHQIHPSEGEMALYSYFFVSRLRHGISLCVALGELDGM